MRGYSTSPVSLAACTWTNRRLLLDLIKRDIAGRYRGSVLGVAWSFVNPLLMLLIYTFVFSVVFKARWGIGDTENRTDFAILLFVGLITHGLFAECVNRAPSLIISNVNYVKKIVFPLEILPWVALGSALFHTAISATVLFLAQLILFHSIPITALLFPVVLLPLLLATLGITWFLASLGVYLRDIGQLTGMFTTALLFVSAVFFPITALPEAYQPWMRLNPLAQIIEQARQVVILGELPSLYHWSILMLAGALIAWAGFAWFQKTRRGFADVL